VGSIVTGEDSGLFGAADVMTSDAMVEKLTRALADEAIDGVIFRVDSGGGSALASDLIWRATQRVKAKKPIVVSMADVAGSGGYYIACGASSIVAQPGTITGSIGILTVEPSLGKLLQKIGVGYEALGRGEFADLGRIDRPRSEPELARIHDSIASLYDLFITRVGQGRGLAKERVNEIGRGRVYTGEQALALGLVDRLGGFEEAKEELRRLLEAPEDQPINLIYKREKVSLWKVLTGRGEDRILEGMLSAEERALLKEIRLQGRWRPGQPLAVMAGPHEVR